ncbi:MAG: site-specific DNA-methyltransferase [Alphaproteobacteria bacterium]
MENFGAMGVCCDKMAFQSKIITGDVLMVLRRQPINLKFDVVIADPPYNIGKDFGNNDDDMPIDEYVDWCGKWLSQCFHLLADNGLVYVYGFPEVLARIAVNYPINEQRWLAWHYTNKAVPSSKFWQRSHEAILCLWKPGTKRPTLEIEQIREPYTPHFQRCTGKVRNGTNGRYSRGGKKTIYNDNGGALPRDVIDVPALAGGAGRAERWFSCRDCGGAVKPPGELPKHTGHDTLKHPTQKPMELTKRLIQSRINGNAGRTLIPFAGSGSECVVAKSLDVPYLGIEINPEFARFGRSWVKQCIN